MPRQVKILGFSKFAFPADKRQPYSVTLDLKGDGVGQAVPMTSDAFFALLNSLVAPREESCGNVHVPTVNVPDT